MLDRQACERRVYRLATLLAGNAKADVGVIEAVVDAQPDLRKLDSAHLDRLTVLRARDVKGATLETADVPRDVAGALASLPSQPREAWVLTRVYRMPLRETARAMDCSVTATTRHLRQAEDSMAAALGDRADMAPPALLDFSMALDVPAFYRIRRRRRQRMRRLRRVALVGLGLLALMVVAAWLRHLRVAG
jgi:DNA-directed RNA polymerase specialized sigma24 family protein